MNTKLMENAYFELHKFLIEHNLTYLYFIVILISGLLFLMGWIISARKSSVEIKKIKAEYKGTEVGTDLKEAELIQKITTDFIIPYSQKFSVFQTLFNELIDKIKYKEKKLIVNYWEKVKNSYDELLICFLSYFEYIKRTSENDDDKKDFVNTVALDLLKNLSDYKNSITSDELTQYIGIQNNFSNHIIKQLIDFSKKNIQKENTTKLNQYIVNLNN